MIPYSSRATAEQLAWLEELGRVPGITAILARPSDWPEIERALREASRPDHA